MRILCSLFVITFLLLSCNNSNQADNNTIQTQPSGTNFSGTFSGLIPCADCPGIELTVSFKPDSSYTESMIYQERNSFFKDTGRWALDNKILTVQYNKVQSDPRYFLIKSDTTVAWLDADKKEIDGPLKERYILREKK